MLRDRGRKLPLRISLFVVAFFLVWSGQGHTRPLTVPGGVPDYFETPNWANSPPLRKFVDTLPGLNTPNNLGQMITVAVPDTTTYPGSDYYEIELVEYREQMHSDFPPVVGGKMNPAATGGTKLRGYRQTNTANADLLTPHYLGPLIVAQKDRPVRIKFTNALPTGAGGNLFLPVDETIMGSGMFEIDYDPVTKAPIPMVSGTFAQNRATLHLHGGRTPWISDGTPHQWITPAGEATSYAKGVSVAYVPDMWFDNTGATIAACAKLTTCGVAGATNNPGPGSQTFYYTNQQSGRLMFYHDHAWGITRLNVYAGEAAGYLIQDNVELALVNGGTVDGRTFNAGTIPSAMIPLVIQDKTFVDNTAILGVTGTDPTWNWGTGPRDVSGNVTAAVTGDLWYPHVYMPAENPYNPDLSGMNPFGRWFYGPWFYPATPLCGSSPNAIPPYCITQGPVPNYHYLNDPNCYPIETGLCTQPPEMPGTPDVSWGAEAFMDTMLVNGTAYPTLTVQPQAYRFRILSAGNDRFLNLQLYVADNTYAPGDPGFGKEVKMVPSAVRQSCSATVTTNCVCTATDAPAGCFPDTWPADGREGGVPDPAFRGPAFVQIGTEGGFLPGPVVLPNQPVSWNYDPTTFSFGNVNGGTLLLGPAERADVIVDFSQFAGKTLILYNDAPTAFPALVPQYDYYTGAPDRTDIGGVPTILPGFAPNVRTVMQIQVAGSGGTAPADYVNPTNLAALDNAFRTTAGSPGVFSLAQDNIIVGQTAYDVAYNKTFPSTWPNWGIVRITDNTVSFQKTDGTTMKNLIMRPKAAHDEMGGSFDELGRMAAKLGLEVQSPSAANANFILQNYVDPATELMESGEVQIWKISHNGVDTHPIHFHLFDVQILNRVAWDGIIMPPDPNELGWKDTIKLNPLMDTIVAMKSALPTVPFALPNSVRPLNPAAPLGSMMGFSQVNTVDGGPLTTPMTNSIQDFGHEYVWHCHILAHEENDMMRSISARVPLAVPAAPSGLNATITGTGLSQVNLVWADGSTNETGFRIQRRAGTSAYIDIATVYSNMTTYTDTALARNTTYRYRVYAFNTLGSSTASNVSPAVTTGTFPNATGVTITPSVPSPADIGTTVNFVGSATGGTGNYQYEFRNITGGGNTVVQAYSTNPTYRWYTNGLAAGTYSFRINARTVGTTTAVAATTTFTIATSTAKTVVLSAAPPSPQPSGTSVTFSALASGGSGTYEYQFSDNVSGVMTTVQAYSSSASFVWNTTGLANGTYQFQVTARNAGSAAIAEATSTPLSFTLQTGMGVTLATFPTSPQPPGTYVAIVATGTGGSGTYEYQFSDNTSGVMAVTQPYSQTSVKIWNSLLMPFGTYSIKVDIRNVGSTATSEGSTTIAYTLAPLPATVVTLNPPSPASPQAAGTSVTWTAAASGGSGSYQYQFWLSDGTSWSILKPYGATNDNTLTWNTTGLAARTYWVQVWARSAGSTAEWEAYSTPVAFVIQPPASSAVTLNPPSPASPQAAGTSVTWTAAASGGSGSYQYQFWLSDGTSWSILKPYGATNDNTLTWNTTGLAARTYWVQVWARSAGSTAEWEAYSTPAAYVLQ